MPSVEALRKLQDHLVLDKEGKSRTFRSLYNGKNSARRVLIIFIRHFFCGVRATPNVSSLTPGSISPYPRRDEESKGPSELTTPTRTARTTSVPSAKP